VVDRRSADGHYVTDTTSPSGCGTVLGRGSPTPGRALHRSAPVRTRDGDTQAILADTSYRLDMYLQPFWPLVKALSMRIAICVPQTQRVRRRPKKLVVSSGSAAGRRAWALHSRSQSHQPLAARNRIPDSRCDPNFVTASLSAEQLCGASRRKAPPLRCRTSIDRWRGLVNKQQESSVGAAGPLAEEPPAAGSRGRRRVLTYPTVMGRTPPCLKPVSRLDLTVFAGSTEP
jgi:hypothetical protein